MQKFAMWMGLVMGLVFVGFAVLIVLRPPENDMIANNKYVVGVVLLLYGLFRLYRSIRMMRGKDGTLN